MGPLLGSLLRIAVWTAFGLHLAEINLFTRVWNHRPVKRSACLREYLFFYILASDILASDLDAGSRLLKKF